MDDDKFFIHPDTGEKLPDKRLLTQKIETTLAKVALSQDMTEATIKNMERAQTTNNAMLENLIRSEYKSLKEELAAHNKENMRDFGIAIETQKKININICESIKEIKDEQKKHNDRITVLETKPVNNKAKIFDKVMIALGGGLITLFVSYIISIVDAVAKSAH